MPESPSESARSGEAERPTVGALPPTLGTPPPIPEALTPTSEARGSRMLRGWRFVVATLAGLLIAVAIAGVTALAFTVNVGDVVNNALRNDIELEDEADDLRAAVLDLRHYHRNLVFTGPTRAGLADFDRAYAALLEELDELESVPVSAPGIIAASDLRQRVRAYYDAYRPAIGLHAVDRVAFDAASDEGLAALADLEAEAQELEDLSEALSESALSDVRATIDRSTVILMIILLGLGAVGLALAVAAARVLGEQRRLYAAQRESAERLAHALRARTDFIADASHELRTPLTVLRGNAEVGLAAGPGDCGHDQVLREIVAESERMTRLVEDLLLLARFDAGAMHLETQEVDVEPWLSELAARGEILARERGVTLAPSIRAEGRARIDTRRLDQAVMVLLDNATKYSPPAGSVRLDASTTGGTLLITVSDDGRGIPPEALPFIFERFNRGDRSRGQRRSGAGLGLSIARAIVTAHGGTIAAQSRVGVGTTMTITLPQVTVAPSPPGISRVGQAAPAAQPVR